MEQLIAQYWGPILAAGILGAFLLAGRRGWKRAEAECGPGCICGGENLRRQQQTTALIQSQEQTPAPIVIHAPTSAYQPQQPQIIVLQAPAPAPQQYAAQPQIIYLQAPESQPRQLPAPRPTVRYEPAPERYAPQEIYSPPASPQSYYPGPEMIIEDYQQRQFPPGTVLYLPPPNAQQVEELRRRFEEEKRQSVRRR